MHIAGAVTSITRLGQNIKFVPQSLLSCGCLRFKTIFGSELCESTTFT